MVWQRIVKVVIQANNLA